MSEVGTRVSWCALFVRATRGASIVAVKANVMSHLNE
jgi:hypothetical protein